jgi:hypothetical protein
MEVQCESVITDPLETITPKRYPGVAHQSILSKAFELQGITPPAKGKRRPE